jgi:hypothetical protein
MGYVPASSYLRCFFCGKKSKRVLEMARKIKPDYKQHYETILAKDKDLHKVQASDFLCYFSDLIIKYSNLLETKVGDK